MNDIYIARTIHSPEVDFQFSNHRLSLAGEAHPENTNEFFYPILMGLENYLQSIDGHDVEFNFRLTHFNSAATKMLYNMFELLNESACSKNRVLLNWHHDDEDDTILEFGEDVQDDFRALEFRAIAVDPIAA